MCVRLKKIEPLTETQAIIKHEWEDGKHIVAYGSAGTGKTFYALYLALKEALADRHRQILIVRSAVPTRDIGFLPGNLEEKLAEYFCGYEDMIADGMLKSPEIATELYRKRTIVTVSTSYLRGLTFDNTIMVLDEVQNFSWHEIYTTITRVGRNSRVMALGDSKQTDLVRGSGIEKLIAVAQTMDEFACIEFEPEDIVRSKFVKNWIVATENVT